MADHVLKFIFRRVTLKLDTLMVYTVCQGFAWMKLHCGTSFVQFLFTQHVAFLFVFFSTSHEFFCPRLLIDSFVNALS
jgi:hypothetical protein